MGDENPIRTLGDYSKPSHEGYRNTIELPARNNVVPFRSDTIRTIKLRNDILMFQQHHGESLSEAWTRFKDLLQKVPHHGIDLWLQVQIFYDYINPVIRQTIDQLASGNLRDRNAEESWALLEDLALYDNKSWNNQGISLSWSRQSLCLKMSRVPIPPWQSHDFSLAMGHGAKSMAVIARLGDQDYLMAEIEDFDLLT
ncbi:zinc finger, CCHC-type containing protein, partial [Tanacetum coccineum]